MNFKSLTQQMGENLHSTFRKESIWDYAWVAGGAASYMAVPTAIQGWFNVDMSGWKGWVTSMLTNALIGGVTGKATFVAGAVGAGVLHLLYGKLQNTLVQPIFRSYGYKFLPSAPDSLADNNANSAPQLQQGAQYNAYDNQAGQPVVFYNIDDMHQAQQGMSDYYSSLPSETSYREGLQGFHSSIPEIDTRSTYSTRPNKYADGRLSAQRYSALRMTNEF